jgi:hypothetical protein
LQPGQQLVLDPPENLRDGQAATLQQ